MIGQTLSGFRITDKLGEGGMGQVYRAEDTTLGREVAIKVLPEEVTGDPERLARFEREAKMLAALNHPNIGSVYQVARAEGLQLLVMELVEGEDLSERLGRGTMTAEEAAPIALQIAQGLEAAHERGIVHRDLKPANVRITPEGQVKILDFGLAKAWEGGAAAGQDLSLSPTVTAQMTQAGVILGTAGYMSPEQARGQEADHRSDIWAFGVLLYEMMTGARLFQADTVSDTLARVLLAEVDWEEVDATVPRPLARLLHRCLEREPRNRLQAIGEARYALEGWIADPDERPTAAVGDETTARWRGGSWLPWAISVAALLLATWAWWSPSSPSAPEVSELLKFRLQNPEFVVHGDARPFVISPDGTRIVARHRERLEIRELGELDSRTLVPDLTTGAKSAPFWSPDGQWVGYTEGGRLWKVPAEGGRPSPICSVPNNFTGAAWGADDRITYALTRGDVYQVSARGGEPRLLIERVPGEDVDFHVPTFLPDGRSLLYSVHRPSGVDTLEVFDGSERRVIYRLEGQVRSNPQVLNDPFYSATGHIVYRRDAGDRGVWALPFSIERLEAEGEPFLVAGEGDWPSLSADGRRLVYAIQIEAAPAELVRVSRDGSAPTPIGEPVQILTSPAVSPDGELIVFSAEVGSNMELLLTDLEGRQVRLTTTPEAEWNPCFTPDGASVIFERSSGEGAAIYRMPVAGGPAEKLLDHAADPSVSATGRWVAFNTSSRESMGVGALDLETGQEVMSVLSANEFAGTELSPDERVLAYSGWETGSSRVSLLSFPDGAAAQIVPDSGESDLVWSRDGRTLYYRSLDGGPIYSVSVRSEPSLLVGRPEIVLDPSTLEGGETLGQGLGLFPDGSFLMTRPITARSDLNQIILVQNWFEEFRE